MIFGYIITAVVAIAAAMLIASCILSRKEIAAAVKGSIDRYSIAGLAVALAIFILFSVLFITPTEQLYFDENIYQGIALNILHSGNALWCQYGTGMLRQCFINQIYHDPVEWSIFIAVAFYLFGVGASTAYGLQLLTGALSIICLFLLMSALIERKEVVITSVLILALMPQLLIWSRTQAVPDVPFMMLSELSIFFFVVFIKKMNAATLAAFASSLLLVVYSRIEAILMLPLFLIFYLFVGRGELVKIAKNRVRIAIEAAGSKLAPLIVALVFVLMLIPQVYYIAMEMAAGNYGQSFTNQSLFSFSNFRSNAAENIIFLFGGFNSVSRYPAAYPGVITVLALGGVIIALLFWKHDKNILIISSAWFLTYFLFYGFFYAGGATFGVDARFMLQLMPSIAILAGLLVGELSGFFKDKRLKAAVYCALVAAIAAYMLISEAGVITIKQNQMPLQGSIAGAVNFLDANYNKVPANCLVFSFTPDVWYEFNRSSVQIGYINNPQPSFSNYSCFVVDYGYWCQVPPYNQGICKAVMDGYKMQTLAENNTIAGRVALYKILNYTQ